MMDNLIANKPKKLQFEGLSDYLNGKEIIVPSVDKYDDEGDDHIFTGIETPLRKEAFVKSDDQKIVEIEQHFRSIMEIMALDLNDDSLKGTPHSVAKMYIKEIFSGLNPANLYMLSRIFVLVAPRSNRRESCATSLVVLVARVRPAWLTIS